MGGPGVLVVVLDVAIVLRVVVVVVVVSGEISLISHTFHPVDFSPGFASSINLQFSVGQSHVAIQIRVPANSKSCYDKLKCFNANK